MAERSSEEYSDDYAEGMIIRQSTDAGTEGGWKEQV